MKRIKNSDMAQTLNGQPQPIQPMVQSAMFYPNTYLNFTQAGEYTKHYYNGTERIASRLGEQQVPVSVENEQELEAYKQDVKQMIYNAIGQHLYDEPTDMQEGDVIPLEFLQATGDNNAVYYYHPNHLSSSMYVTDAQQSVVQSFLYAPYGEIISEYNTHAMGEAFPKYSFNAKELDEETGMYYYEARYYAPPTFTSRDLLFEKYFWLSPYAYCANNPVKYVDPDGEFPLSGVAFLFFNGGIGAGVGCGLSANQQSGIAYDKHGTTHFVMSRINCIVNQNLYEGSLNPNLFIGAEAGVSVGFAYNWKAESFLDAVSSFSFNISVSGKAIIGGEIGMAEGSFSASVGIGGGLSINTSSMSVDFSVSLTKEEANIVSNMTDVVSELWGVNNIKPMYEKGKISGFSGTVYTKDTNGKVINTGISVTSGYNLSNDKKTATSNNIWVSEEYNQSIK